MIKRHKKSIQWLKNICGVTNKEINKWKVKYPIVYVYELYSGGDDKIELRCFNTVLPDKILESRFTEQQLGGQLVNNEVCEIDLREEQCK